jgi:hypothetical protein
VRKRIARILPWVALALVFGCSRADDLPGYTSRSGDLGKFILQHAARFGAHARQTNDLPKLKAEWHYKEDADGFHIRIVGNHFTPLHTFLTSAFGEPAQPPATNELAGSKSIGARYGAELGADLTYGLESTLDGKKFTTVVLARQKK